MEWLASHGYKSQPLFVGRREASGRGDKSKRRTGGFGSHVPQEHREDHMDLPPHVG